MKSELLLFYCELFSSDVLLDTSNQNCPVGNAARITSILNGATTLMSLFILLDVEIGVFINKKSGWQILTVLPS